MPIVQLDGRSMAAMRITYLFEDTATLWGGVKAALDDANALVARGHEVTVVSKSAPPAWMDLETRFLRVTEFDAESVPSGDVIVGTYWSTVPFAILAAQRDPLCVPVHLCQGYEGEHVENDDLRRSIESVYAFPDETVRLITISPHLTRIATERFGRRPIEVVYAIDHEIHHPDPEPRETPTHRRVRVGLVGPYEIDWKDIPTGLQACALAHAAGLELELVRVTNTKRAGAEENLPYPVEWHERVPPHEMGKLYRSLDVFLGTSRGSEEGFFLPAIEAMACGIPAVLTDIPCFRGYGEGQYALFVPPEDPAAMAEALTIAALEPDTRRSLRDQALAVAGRYRRDRKTEQIERAFSTFVRERARQSDLIAAVLTGDEERVEGTSASTEAADSSRSASKPSGPCIDMDYAALLGSRRSGDHVRALELAYLLESATQSLAVDSSGVAAWHARGVLELAANRLAYAVAALEQAIDRAGRDADPVLWNDLGVACFQSGLRDRAREAFSCAATLDPTYADAQANASDPRLR
jgi:glycosyltransferase involved in cell wall biosynthesis